MKIRSLLPFIAVSLFTGAQISNAAVVYSGTERSVTFMYDSSGGFTGYSPWSLFMSGMNWDRFSVYVDPFVAAVGYVGSGNYVAVANAGTDYASNLSVGDSVGPTLEFQDTAVDGSYLVFSGGGSIYGNFNNTRDYLGLKYQIGANIYYGWMQIEVSGMGTSDPRLSLMDWAWEDTPGQEIIVGSQTGIVPEPSTLLLGAVGGLGLLRRRR